jgi:hypothetical protein
MENEKTKIWLGEDGIIRLKIEKDFKETSLENIYSEFKEIVSTLPQKPNVLIDVTGSVPLSASIFRKNVVKIVKDGFKNPGVNKIAEWGITDSFIKTITLFVVATIGQKRFKYFETEEEALEWFKEK